MSKTKNILVTGGAGYIGSHMVRVLLEKGYRPVVFDNLSTGHRAFVPRGVPFVKGDLRDPRDIEKVFTRFSFDAVMHFAALIVVSESVARPLEYYENNVVGSLYLVQAMLRHKVCRIIFSSTAAIYGVPETNPLQENARIAPKNPYGETKAITEKILMDVSAYSGLKYISLRYFNAAGAIKGAAIGEKHNPETHLIPNVLKAAKHNRPFYIFGDNYRTRDGTCVRDYVHVMDLCEAHYLALNYLNREGKSDVFNLGTGKGFTVREVVKAVEGIIGGAIKINVQERRPGDVHRLVADPRKAEKILRWKCQRGLEEVIRSAWDWERSYE